jgi:hypothetical protein
MNQPIPKPATTPDYTGVQTVRARIMQQLKTNIEAMTLKNSTVKWTTVMLEPLDTAREEQIIGDAISLYDNRETYTYEVGCVLCVLQVQCDYWYKLKAGQSASVELERLRGDLVKAIVADQQLTETETNTPLTIGIHVLNYDKDIESPRAEFVGGFLEIEIRYRHKKQDPAALVGT